MSNERQENLPDKDTHSRLPTPDSRLPNIPGLDIQKGISMTGGTVDVYTQVLSLFCTDARDRLPILQKAPEAAALSAFITQVHALKSALASIGASGISSVAAGLESAGKAGDMPFIREHLPSFAEQLAELVKNIHTALQPNESADPDLKSSIAHSSLLIAHSSLLNDLAEALKSQKISEIKRILNELNQQTQDPKLKKILEQISDQVLMTEFDSALKILDEVRRT